MNFRKLALLALVALTISNSAYAHGGGACCADIPTLNSTSNVPTTNNWKLWAKYAMSGLLLSHYGPKVLQAFDNGIGISKDCCGNPIIIARSPKQRLAYAVGAAIVSFSAYKLLNSTRESQDDSHTKIKNLEARIAALKSTPQATITIDGASATKLLEAFKPTVCGTAQLTSKPDKQEALKATADAHDKKFPDQNCCSGH